MVSYVCKLIREQKHTHTQTQTHTCIKPKAYAHTNTLYYMHTYGEVERLAERGNIELMVTKALMHLTR